MGDQLAFFACTTEGKCGLYLLDTEESELRMVTKEVMGYLTLLWNPDGKELASYATGTGGEKFYIINVDRGEILFTSGRDIDLQASDSPIREWGVTFDKGKDCFNDYLDYVP